MSTVKALGIEVPVHDYLTGHEWEQVELLLDETQKAKAPRSDLRDNLRTFGIFVKSRTKQAFDPDDYLDEPIDGNELSEAIEALLAPFVNARRERAEKRLRTQASRLTPKYLREMKAKLEADLATVNEALSEADGRESEQPSSTTTPAGASKGGGKGRSKKRSN